MLSRESFVGPTRGKTIILLVALSIVMALVLQALIIQEVHAAQFARPGSDITTGDFSAPIWSAINEVAPDDDATFSVDPTSQSGTTLEVGLSDVTDPQSSAEHTVRFRARKTTNRNSSVAISLVQGTTVVASSPNTALATSYQTISFTISAAATDAITNYADLRIRATFVDNGGGGPAGAWRATWAELEIPDAPPPPSGSGGGAIEGTPRYALFSGQAYPGATMEILRRSPTDPRYRVIAPEVVTVNSDGSFTIRDIGILSGNHLFAINTYDKDGSRAGTLTFDIAFGDFSEIHNLLVSPTVNVEKQILSRSDALRVRGYATPNYMVELELDGAMHSQTQADASGSWGAELDISGLQGRSHHLRARQVAPSGEMSNFSPTRTFYISQLAFPRADLNSDGAINLSDWSIFLFQWGSDNQETRFKNDLNEDGRVNIFDFSILLRLFIFNR